MDMGFSVGQLNDMYLDILKELGNIGAGHSATALSLMVNRPISMSVPELNLVKFNEAGDIVGDAEKKVTGIYLEFYGDIEGTLLFMLDSPSTVALLKLLIDDSNLTPKDKDMGPMEISALKEIGNILTGSFLMALEEMTDLSIKYTMPDLSVDMAGAILSVPLTVFGQQGDRALFIKTNLFEGIEQITGWFFLIPNPSSYAILLKTLKAI